MPPAPTAVPTAAASPDVTVPPSAQPAVSVVVVTYGAGQEVLDTIRSLVRETPPIELEVIVVDNPVEDGRTSADLLRTATAGVHLVANDRNVGYGPANDIGVAAARGALVCLCNPDIVVPPGWLPPLVGALDDPLVGIAAPVLVDADGSLQEAGQLLLADGNTMAIGGPELFTGDWSQAFARDLDYASAAMWLLRRSEYLGFNPRLVPAYFEDVDYALRLEQHGQVTRLVPDRPVTHVHRSSASAGARALAERSQAIFRAEWAGRLPDQASRPASAVDALLARDRRCTGRIAVVATRARRVPEAAATAWRLASERPRWRVTLIAEHVDPAALPALAAAGVEVALGDPAATMTTRAPWLTAVVTGFGRLGRQARRALVAAGVQIQSA